MPFVGTEFVNVAGASNAAPGQTVQSAVWNAIHIDQESGLTQLNSQYSSVSTSRNILWMNGGLEVWQRGAGSSASISMPVAASQSYTADRWYLFNSINQNCTVSAQTGLVSESRLSAKVQRNAGQTGTGRLMFCYPLDTDEIVRMRGNKVTISVLLKAGANFSGGTITAALYTGTGAGPTKGGFEGAGFTGAVTNLSITTAFAATQTALVTGTSSAVVSTATTQAEFQIYYTPNGTAGVDDSITIDDASLEAVTTSYTDWTVMSYDRVPFPMMLEACKRFYQKTFAYDTAPANNIIGYTGSVSLFNSPYPGLYNLSVSGFGDSPITWNLPVELRRVPEETDITVYNPASNTANTAFATNGPANMPIRAYWARQTKQLVIDFNDAGNSQMFAHMTVTADIT